MAPGSFASIALARTLSSETIERRATHISYTLDASMTNILNASGNRSHVIKKVRFDIQHRIMPDQQTSSISMIAPKVPQTIPPQIYSPTSAPIKYTLFPTPVLVQKRVITSTVSTSTVPVQQLVKRRKLTPTGQFEAMLNAELTEKKRLETEKVGREIWS